MTKVSRRALVSLAIALAAVLGAIWMAPRAPSRSPGGDRVSRAERHQAAIERAAPHLAWADEQCLAAIDPQAAEVTRFFHDAQARTKPFVEEALGWGSKWRLMADHVPYTRGGRHEAYLRERFEKLVFSPTQLEQAVSGAVAGYLADVRSLEGRMLVKLRADMSDVPGGFSSDMPNEAEFRQLYDEALTAAARTTGGSLQADVGTQLVSLIAGEVLTGVAVRLGVSAGILSAGAASSWATLGVGFVVGVIVDQIVCWVWDWYADPEGDLTTELNGRLDGIRRMMVDGPGGLRERLERYATERAMLRQQAVWKLLESAP